MGTQVEEKKSSVYTSNANWINYANKFKIFFFVKTHPNFEKFQEKKMQHLSFVLEFIYYYLQADSNQQFFKLSLQSKLQDKHKNQAIIINMSLADFNCTSMPFESLC